MYYDLEDFIPWVCGAIGVALIALLIYASIQDEKTWNAFRVAHACKIVGQMEGSTETGVAPIIGGNGGVAITTSSTPGKTGWLCDDGVTYWRNK